MKKTILLTIVCAFLLPLGSCLQKNGDIGPWFGSWYLTDILINGEPDPAYEQNKEDETLEVMVSFQGGLFNMAYLNGSEIYGSWECEGNILTLIAHTKAPGQYVSPNFNPYPKVMHFPADMTQVEITVTKMPSRTMQWQYIDQNGDLLTYNFKKYP